MVVFESERIPIRTLLSSFSLLTLLYASALAQSPCQHRFYLDQTNTWGQCEVGCQTCTSELICTSCDPGYFQNATICTQCDSQCLTCVTNSTNCVTCDHLGYTPYLSGNSCVGACPSTHWLNGTICDACNSTCLSCDGPLGTDCTACHGDQILKDGACVACPSGQFNNNGACAACNATCATCNSTSTCTSCGGNYPYFYPQTQACLTACPPGTYANSTNFCLACNTNCVECINSATQCTACELEMELLGDDTCGFPTCSSGTYNASNVCSPCNANCLSCVNSANNCYLCDEDGDVPILSLQDNTCVATCPSGTYVTDDENCGACDSSCSGCDVQFDNCTACASTSPLTINGVGSCAGSCPSGQFNNTNVCSACDASCATCDGPLATDCTSCSGTAVLSAGVCTSCPSGTYNSNNVCQLCSDDCETCSSATFCLSCNTTSYYNPLAGTCNLECPAGMYPDASRICQACSTTCRNCTSATTCTSCNLASATKKFNPTDNSCSQWCPDGTWDNNHTCEPCDSNCLTCTGNATTCVTCNEETNLSILNTISSTCESACPSGSFQFQSSCYECCSPCSGCSAGPLNCTACNPTSSYPYLNATTHTCLASCPTGTWNDNSVCQECTTGCSACSSASVCSDCFDGFYLLNGQCLPCSSSCATCTGSATNCGSCSPQTYPDNGSNCVPCVSPCVTCTTQSECLSCISTHYLGSDGVTCETCPAGQFSNSTGCESCDPACATCTLGTTSDCGSCNTGFYLTGTTCLGCDQSCSACNGATATDCTACNAGFFVSNSLCTTCIPPCQNCSSATQCSSCVTGYFLSGNSCIQCNAACASCTSASIDSCATCSPNYYQPVSTTSCLACDSSCNGCSTSGNTSCSECATGYFNSTGTCTQCEASCAACEGPLATNCTECASDKFLQTDGTCVGCVANCIDCEGPNISDCIQCAEGYFISQSACQQCDASCQNCSGNTASDCAECAAGFSLHAQTCLSQCPQGYTSVDKICERKSNLTSLVCPTGSYIYQATCLGCPTTTAIPDQQLSAALVSCDFSSLTPSQETKLLDLVTSDLSTLLSSTSSSSDDAQDLISKVKNTALSISSQIDYESTSFKLRKFPVTSQETTIDTGSSSTTNRVQVSLMLDSSVTAQSGNIIGSVFRQALFTSPALTPTFDLNLEVSGNEVSVYNANTQFAFQFNTIPTGASNGMKCVYWNVTNNAWQSDGVTTASASGSTVRCITSHFTSFAVIEDPNGITFGTSHSAPIYIPLYICLYLSLIMLIALLTDCFVVKRKGPIYPHLRGNKATYCTVCKYSFLYNFLFLNIWGFKTKEVYSVLKALWTSALVWLVVIIFTLLFEVDIESGESYYPVISVLCGLIFLPNSILQCCLVKYSEKKEYHLASQGESSKSIKTREMPYEQPASPRAVSPRVQPQPPQSPAHQGPHSDTDRKIAINVFDFTHDEGTTTSLKTRKTAQPQTVYNRIGFTFLILFTSLTWILGITLSILLHPDIHETSENAYNAMAFGIALSVPLGMLFGLIKIMISSCVALRQKENPKMCHLFIVDIETAKIVEYLDKQEPAQSKRAYTETPELKNRTYGDNPDDQQFVSVVKPEEE